MPYPAHEEELTHVHNATEIYVQYAKNSAIETSWWINILSQARYLLTRIHKKICMR